MEPVSPLIIAPIAGEPIKESYIKRITDGVNTVLEPTSHVSAPVRWAKTTAHADDGYPAVTDNPIAYPFRWVQLVTKSSADPGTVKPPRGESEVDQWEYINGRADTNVGINGYAVNLNETQFTGSTKPIDYIPEDTLVLVASGAVGCYWFVREMPRLFLFKTTTVIDALDSGTYSSELCDMYAVDHDGSGSHTARSLGVQKRVINPLDDADIDDDIFIWAEQCVGGDFVATIIPCDIGV